MNWISKGFVPVRIGFILLLAISLVGCPQERLKEGLSVSLEQDGVYFVFDRYDILDVVRIPLNTATHSGVMFTT